MIVFHSKARKKFWKIRHLRVLVWHSYKHSLENTWVGVFFKKILLKRISNKGVLLRILRNSKEQNLPVAIFWSQSI